MDLCLGRTSRIRMVTNPYTPTEISKVPRGESPRWLRRFVTVGVELSLGFIAPFFLPTLTQYVANGWDFSQAVASFYWINPFDLLGVPRWAAIPYLLIPNGILGVVFAIWKYRQVRSDS